MTNSTWQKWGQYNCWIIEEGNERFAEGSYVCPQ